MFLCEPLDLLQLVATFESTVLTLFTVAVIVEAIFGWLSNGALHIAADLFAFVLETNAEHLVILEAGRTGAVRQAVGGSVRLEVGHKALSGSIGRAEHQPKAEQNQFQHFRSLRWFRSLCINSIKFDQARSKAN